MTETMRTSGAMFEPSRHNGFEKVQPSSDGGAHYSVWHMDSNNGRTDPVVGMESLRSIFPDGEATDLNFVLFSTSGVHGSYTTIEEIEEGLTRYGDDFEPGNDDWPDGWHGRDLTALIVQPRIVCLRCGNIRVGISDIAYLKKLRSSSVDAMTSIGFP